MPTTQDTNRQTDRQTDKRHTDISSTLTSTHFILCINICSSSQQQSHSFHMSILRGLHQSSPSHLSPHPIITGINTMAMIALRKVHIVINNNSIRTNNTRHKQTDRQTRDTESSDMTTCIPRYDVQITSLPSPKHVGCMGRGLLSLYICISVCLC